jgi:hypothetical protein
MKKTFISLIILVAGVQLLAKEKITIPASDAVELTYEQFALYDVQIASRSGDPLDVSVIDPDSREQVSGFGLAARGKVVLYVAEGNVLKLENSSSSDVTVVIDFVDREPAIEKTSPAKSVTFTLHNSSSESIPLVIPGVMNPNLSPMSNSGVALEIGQKIYYKQGMKKVLILTVDSSIENGDKIDIAARVEKIE